MKANLLCCDYCGEIITSMEVYDLSEDGVGYLRWHIWDKKEANILYEHICSDCVVKISAKLREIIRFD